MHFIVMHMLLVRDTKEAHEHWLFGLKGVKVGYRS